MLNDKGDHVCPKCKTNDEPTPLHVANSRFESDVGSTDIYSCLGMVCVNPKCSNFSGPDLSNPKTIVETVRNKIN